jgi:hypothetical protein
MARFDAVITKSGPLPRPGRSARKRSGMVRSWNQLVASAAHLWAALSSPRDYMSGLDPMECLRLVGEVIGRSVRAGHWPGHGPTDDHLTEIARQPFAGAGSDRARRHGRPSGPATADRHVDTPDVHGQVIHVVCRRTRNGCRTRWVCNGAAAPTGGRHPPATAMAERPTTLEITEAQGMIAGLGGFEQLAAVYMFGQPRPPADPGQLRAASRAIRLETALAAWAVQAHRTLAANPDPATWCGSPACRH